MANPFLIDIPDKNEYTLEDYANIQKQLENKNIETLLKEYFPPKNRFYSYEDFKYRCTMGTRMKIVDLSSNMIPTKNLYKIGNGGDGKNCIVCCTPFAHETIEFRKNVHIKSRFFASQQIMKSLEEVGYNGHFYLFNGGFPCPTGTEMKFAGVPYCLKIFMMLEAKKLGFDKVIWIDSGCYALNSPQRLFDILDTQETVMKTCRGYNNYEAMCFSQTINLLNSINGCDINGAYYIESVVFGLNLTSPLIQKIISEYYFMVSLGLPFLSIFPEEIVLTSIFNKPEYKHLLYNQPESLKVHIHETRLNTETATANGFFFHHRKYKEVVETHASTSSIIPLSFAIPDECVVPAIPKKDMLLASLIPGDVSTYTFKKHQEQEYYQMYQRARFALTKMKGGWDCLRHYEILMNGCIPLFENLKDCPKQTMTTYPKELNDEAYALYNNWQETDENVEKYNALCSKFLEHTRQHCTTSSLAKYFLGKFKKPVKNVLMFTCHTGISFSREPLWIGIKRHIKSIGGTAVEHEKLAFLYDDFDHLAENKYYGNAFTLPRRLQKDEYTPMDEKEIVEKINSKFWDAIIYGKVGPDEFCTFPYYDLVKQRYDKDSIAFMLSGDEIFDLTVTDRSKYHINMFNRYIYYHPYNDYLNKYKDQGLCFVRELNM